jgi:putative ABC transport system permease protein
MKLTDVFSLAFRSIRSNLLRTGITVAIIAFGIMALIGIITAIKAMNQKFTESFSNMGANGFTVRYKERNIRFGGSGNTLKLSKKGERKEKASNLDKIITQDEAETFQENFDFPAVASLSISAGNDFTVSAGNRKTNPTVYFFGGDENYIELNSFDLLAGRGLTRQEVQDASHSVVLGYDVANLLFRRQPSSAIGNIVRINEVPYRVVGVLESKGSTFGFSRDNIILGGYKNVRRYFGTRSFTVGVKTADVRQVDPAMGEAEGIFRAVRKLHTTEENNFTLERSNAIAEKAMSILSYLTIAVIVIGLITLIGSAIGLMNIMLVSVAERTKEVGLIKAIGGKSAVVRQQFLVEALLISSFGALFGIILGIFIGNLFSLVLDTGFVVPWVWIGYGIAICTIVGLLAGLYPALRAGKLNPIEALRYE